MIERVRLLGAFEVLSDGRPLGTADWHNQQTRTILKFLVTHREHVVPGDQLLEVLWPGADPETARRRLHVRISQLRRILDRDDPSKYVSTVDEGYVFRAQPGCCIDVDEFEAQARRGRRCQERGDLEGAIAAYELARSLYAGDFLEEDLYVEWTFAERERLRDRFLTALTELAECSARQGRYRRAIARCREVLAADPCRESVYVRLMLYHYCAGERDLALRVYARCREVLAAELDVEPLPQTTALHEQILQRRVPPANSVTYPEPAFEGQLFEVPYSLAQMPFVGREREYALLVDRLQRVRAGGGAGMVAIVGEAGLGKTRLAEQALGYLGGQGILTLSARCYEVEVDVPYHPLLEALRPLVQGERTPLARSVAPEWAAELVRLFPALPVSAPVPAGPVRQRRLFEAVFQLLAAAAAVGPLVLFVDDAQWIDAASLALWSHLFHRSADLPVAWLAACRPEEVPPEHPLRALFAGLRSDGRLLELELDPLPTGAIGDLLAQMSGGAALDSGLGERLAQESGGNPFYLVSILQNLFEEGALAAVPGGGWRLGGDPVTGFADLMVPTTLRKTLERRLSRLKLEDRRVLEAAAVFGRRFDFDLLADTTQVEEEALLDALDRLTAARLLEERSTPQDLEYDFSHDKLREVTYLDAGAARRRRLHRRAADALAVRLGTDPAAAAESAYHYHRAGRAVDAVRCAIQAGKHALQLYAVQQAARHFEDALHWAEAAGHALDAEEQGALHMSWGDALRRAGRYDEALAHYVQALPLTRAEHKHAVVYQICAVGAMRGRRFSEFARLVPTLEQELASTGDSWALASLRWMQALGAALGGDAMRARACAAAGWRVARRLRHGADQPPAWLTMQVAVNQARAYEYWSEWQRSIRWAHRALDLYTLHGDLNGVAACHNVLGAAFHGLGQWDCALDHFGRCAALADRAGDPRMRGDALYGSALVYLERGDYALAGERARQVLEIGETSGDVVRQAYGRMALACVDMGRGEVEQALAALELIVQVARWSEAAVFVVLPLPLLAEARLLAGDASGAVDTAREGIDLSVRSGQKRPRGVLLRVLGQALARNGQQAEGERCLRDAVALQADIGCRYELAVARCALGVLLLETGVQGLAKGELAAALALFEELGAVPDAERTRQHLGVSLAPC